LQQFPVAYAFVFSHTVLIKRLRKVLSALWLMFTFLT